MAQGLTGAEGVAQLVEQRTFNPTNNSRTDDLRSSQTLPFSLIYSDFAGIFDSGGCHDKRPLSDLQAVSKRSTPETRYRVSFGVHSSFWLILWITPRIAS